MESRIMGYPCFPLLMKFQPGSWLALCFFSPANVVDDQRSSVPASHDRCDGTMTPKWSTHRAHHLVISEERERAADLPTQRGPAPLRTPARPKPGTVLIPHGTVRLAAVDTALAIMTFMTTNERAQLAPGLRLVTASQRDHLMASI